MNAAAPTSADNTVLQTEGWTVHVLDEVGSTNTIAARLPAWSAVRARVQTAGRGRTGRAWASDDGGLWLSAVVPCPGNRSRWAILPLAAGWAIIAALKELGVAGLRLRWPNDLMVGRRKLGGLLVERYTPGTAVVGLGLNVANDPESADPTLAGQTARLLDLIPGDASLDDVARLILRAIGRAQALIRNDDFRVIAEELNLHWSEPRRVAITLNDRAETIEGLFHGIDDRGRLQLSTPRRGRRAYDAAEVALLREVD